MADDFDLDMEPQQDAAASMGSGIVIVTTVILIAAWVVMSKAAADIYGVGMFGD